MATSREKFTPLPIDETRKRTPLKVPYSEEAYHCELPAPIPQRRGMNQQALLQSEIHAIQERVDRLSTQFAGLGMEQLAEHAYAEAGETLHELTTITRALEEWVQAKRSHHEMDTRGAKAAS